MTDKHIVEIYTDGSCKLQDPKRPGAAASIIVLNGSIIYEDVKSFNNTTNNQMELLSAIVAFKELDRLNLTQESKISIYSDSQYFINGMTQYIHNWIKKSYNGVKNPEYWKILENYLKYDIEYHWIRGHNGDYFNERVDTLAQNEMRRLSDANKLSNVS